MLTVVEVLEPSTFNPALAIKPGEPTAADPDTSVTPLHDRKYDVRLQAAWMATTPRRRELSIDSFERALILRSGFQRCNGSESDLTASLTFVISVPLIEEIVGTRRQTLRSELWVWVVCQHNHGGRRISFLISVSTSMPLP
jgi:hypothetical protein